VRQSNRAVAGVTLEGDEGAVPSGGAGAALREKPRTSHACCFQRQHHAFLSSDHLSAQPAARSSPQSNGSLEGTGGQPLPCRAQHQAFLSSDHPDLHSERPLSQLNPGRVPAWTAAVGSGILVLVCMVVGMLAVVVVVPVVVVAVVVVFCVVVLVVVVVSVIVVVLVVDTVVVVVLVVVFVWVAVVVLPVDVMHP